MSDVKDILTEAAQAVDEAGLSADLRQAGFEKAVDLIASKRGIVAAAPGAKRDATAAADAGTPAGTGSLLGRVAERLKVDFDTIAEVYHERDGAFEIVVPASKLDPDKAPAAKQITILVAAARQGSGTEEWTHIDHVRRVAEDFGRYDAANFASAVRATQGCQFRTENRKILVRLSRPGWEGATALVKKLAGVEA